MKTMKLALAAAGLALTAGAASVAYAQYRERSEEPDYTVVLEDGPIELRRYAPMIVAEVTHTGERRRALSAGFSRLAAYIFAQDRPGSEDEKIAMTAPVMQDQAEPIAMTAPVIHDSTAIGSWRTRFVMPSRYTMETLPRTPDDITLTELPSRKLAAIRFSGWGAETDLQRAEQILRDWMAEQRLEASGEAEFAFYDAPRVPGPMRRNEVMIPVADE